MAVDGKAVMLRKLQMLKVDGWNLCIDMVFMAIIEYYIFEIS